MALSKLARKILLVENINLKLDDGDEPLWVHDLNKERKTKGEYHTLFKQLRHYPEKFFEYTRMTTATFDLILNRIEFRLQKMELNYRESISPEERLVVTLRFLATGQSFRALGFSFRMGKSTVAVIVKETCELLWTELHEDYLPEPTTEKWRSIARKYYEKWNFPNCLGSIDGKHIRIKCPSNSGSMYFNYKHFFSINLQAISDADYKFTIIDVGAYGRESDGGVFRNSAFFERLQNNELNIPEEIELPGTNTLVPHVFVGDEAYPLMTHLLRPYPRNQLNYYNRIFNYRLSRARRLVECSFGILTAKWRILNKSIETNVDTAIAITKATCLLHNIIMTHDSKTNLKHDIVLNNKIQPISGRSNNRYSTAARNIRETFTVYFTTPVGEVPWQWNVV